MKTVDNVEKNKKKGSKKLLLIIPIVIIVVLILAFIFGEKVPKVDETDGIKMTADEIAEKFLNDKSGMDKEFHNKVYEVTGNVEDSNGQYSMTLSTESGEYEIYFDVDKEKSNKKELGSQSIWLRVRKRLLPIEPVRLVSAEGVLYDMDIVMPDNFFVVWFFYAIYSGKEMML